MVVTKEIGLLTKYGEAVSVIISSGGTVTNPLTGEQTSTLPDSLPLSGYLGSYKSQDVDGTNIQANDGKLILPPTSPRVSEGLNVTVDGKKFNIINVKAVRKAGVDELQILQVRI